MSEFSENYHIFSKDFKRIAKELKFIGLNGFLFKPTGNWCSFVPFKAFSVPILHVSKLLNAPVLAYYFAEDHAWAAQLTNGENIETYECSWDNETHIDFNNNFIEFIHNLLNIELDKTLIKLLANTNIKDILTEKPSCKFCSALGIEYFDWLAPDYIVKDLDIYKKRKDCQLIGKVPDHIFIDQPSSTKIKLLKKDITAKEAVRILTPYIRKWSNDAEPDFIKLHSRINSTQQAQNLAHSGRLVENKAWKIRYISSMKQVLLWISLFYNGDVEIDAMKYDGHTRVDRHHLPDDFIDSTDLINHVIKYYVTDNLSKKTINSLFLRDWLNELAWEVKLAYTHDSLSTISINTLIFRSNDLELLYQRDRQFNK